MCVYIYIYIYVCVCVCVHVEKAKHEKNVFDGLFINQHILTSIIFSECKNILSKLF